MAHPSFSFPTKSIIINGADIVEADIFAIQVLHLPTDGTTIKVRGSGIFEQLAANDSDGSTHLKADGSGDNLGGTHVAGLYERLSTVDTNMPAAEGATIYGNFNRVEGISGDVLVCYIK